MANETYGRLFGVVGGLLGVLAIFLTWFVASATGFPDTALRLSAFDAILSLIQDVIAGNPLLEPVDLLPVFSFALLVGIGGWGLFLTGSVISVFRPHGGDSLVTLQADLGIFVGFAASIIAVVGIFLRKREIGG